MAKRPGKAKAETPDGADLKPLNPIFAWFEGGDVIQFGELCGTCIESVKTDCKGWDRETLAGLKTDRTRIFRDCPYFVKWDAQEFTREGLSKDDLSEGEKGIGVCPDCGRKELRRAVRTSSEYGTRMNPRAVFLEWCGCGRFRAVKKELAGDRGICVFCGGPTKDAETTVFRGANFHLDCFLRLRFFFTMSEMLRVAEGYMATGKTLTGEESKVALCKTLEMVRAFRLTGNANAIGINRIIHWLEGESPVVSARTVLRTKAELLAHLEATFSTEQERSVGVHILEDGYIVYDNASDVRWITHGAYQIARSARQFVDRFIDLAGEGRWQELDNEFLIGDISDGKCALCGAGTRSHRIATGEDSKNVYLCHHCWTGQTGLK